MIKMKINDPSDIEGLMDAKSYEQMVA
jgi:hypothetical protein